MRVATAPHSVPRFLTRVISSTVARPVVTVTTAAGRGRRRGRGRGRRLRLGTRTTSAAGTAIAIAVAVAVAAAPTATATATVRGRRVGARRSAQERRNPERPDEQVGFELATGNLCDERERASGVEGGGSCLEHRARRRNGVRHERYRDPCAAGRDPEGSRGSAVRNNHHGDDNDLVGAWAPGSVRAGRRPTGVGRRWSRVTRGPR